MKDETEETNPFLDPFFDDYSNDELYDLAILSWDITYMLLMYRKSYFVDKKTHEAFLKLFYIGEIDDIPIIRLSEECLVLSIEKDDVVEYVKYINARGYDG